MIELDKTLFLGGGATSIRDFVCLYIYLSVAWKVGFETKTWNPCLELSHAPTPPASNFSFFAIELIIELFYENIYVTNLDLTYLTYIILAREHEDVYLDIEI